MVRSVPRHALLRRRPPPAADRHGQRLREDPHAAAAPGFCGLSAKPDFGSTRLGARVGHRPGGAPPARMPIPAVPKVLRRWKPTGRSWSVADGRPSGTATVRTRSLGRARWSRLAAAGHRPAPDAGHHGGGARDLGVGDAGALGGLRPRSPWSPGCSSRPRCLAAVDICPARRCGLLGLTRAGDKPAFLGAYAVLSRHGHHVLGGGLARQARGPGQPRRVDARRPARPAAHPGRAARPAAGVGRRAVGAVGLRRLVLRRLPRHEQVRRRPRGRPGRRLGQGHRRRHAVAAAVGRLRRPPRRRCPTTGSSPRPTPTCCASTGTRASPRRPTP